ncbi:MAG: hypothetical protein LBD23_03670 [Oscillospiraceae bacterium]|jgi:hypothetical protein|nr:hypothetical protein [Oscillospiraceae bacterium]
MTYEKTSELINNGNLLHIAGAESLLKKLPKGKWIGGSTEYFMASVGGIITNELLFITELSYENFTIKSYTDKEINRIAEEAYDSGFTILIVPFDSAVHREYAQNAAGYKSMFIKNIAGWVSGTNLDAPNQVPIVVNGETGESFTDNAIALHLEVPAEKTVQINMINIFEQDKTTPIIEFIKEGFSAEKCLINGKEISFAEYITRSGINTKLPIIGDYSGNGINISIKAIENGIVYFYAPVFPNIKYRIAKNISDYALEFNRCIARYSGKNVVFSNNCILNFLYGGLKGKKFNAFSGPITFGEIAYQLVNQTLVYICVE